MTGSPLKESVARVGVADILAAPLHVSAPLPPAPQQVMWPSHTGSHWSSHFIFSKVGGGGVVYFMDIAQFCDFHIIAN